MSLVVNLSEETFEVEVNQCDIPVLVDFWAEWCGPCRALAPVLDQLAEDYSDRIKVAKLDSDQYRSVSDEHGVRGLPTLIVFKDGEELTRFSGAQSRATFDKILGGVLADAGANDLLLQSLESDSIRHSYFQDSTVRELAVVLDERPEYATAPLLGDAQPIYVLMTSRGADKVRLLQSYGVELDAGAMAYLGLDDELAALLVQSPSCVDERDTCSGMPPIYFACATSQLGCVQLLLNYGADAHFVNPNYPNFSFLEWVVGRCDFPIVELLLESADSFSGERQVTNNNYLHAAFQRENEPGIDLLNFLRAKGADCDRLDEKGRTPIEAARSNIAANLKRNPDKADELDARVVRLERLWDDLVSQ